MHLSYKYMISPFLTLFLVSPLQYFFFTIFQRNLPVVHTFIQNQLSSVIYFIFTVLYSSLFLLLSVFPSRGFLTQRHFTIISKISLWDNSQTALTLYKDFFECNACKLHGCGVTFPGDMWANLNLFQTEHWQQTTETIPPKSSLVNQWVYGGHLQVHGWLKSSHVSKSPPRHGHWLAAAATLGRPVYCAGRPIWLDSLPFPETISFP